MTPSPPIRKTDRPTQASPPSILRPQLSIDIVLASLSKSIFHPFIACLLPLCLRALASPYNSTSFILTSVFAATVCCYHALVIIDHRLGYGLPRNINWENEVVVITGGLGGLGGCIAEIYSLRGVSIAVLDIAVDKGKMKYEEAGIIYYHCNVGDSAELATTWYEVAADLGVPTILINNAGINVNGPLAGAQSEDVERIFRVNTLSHFKATQLFIQGLFKNRKSGTIVTVASVLGHVCAAGLGPYSASKAALLAYHTTLSAELRGTAPHIKPILVAPGQLDTQLFADLKLKGWLQRFIGPVVPVSELATKIVQMIDDGEAGEIREPFYARVFTALPLLPKSVQRFLRWWGEIDIAANSAAIGGSMSEHNGSLDKESDTDDGSSNEESDE